MNLADLEILEYTEDMGKVCWPAGFEQELEGKTLQQQLDCYRVIDWGLRPLSYYLLNWEKCGSLETLDQYAGWEKLILRKVMLDFINITIFFLTTAIVYSVETRIFESGHTCRISSRTAFIILCLIAFIFVVFTFFPPQIPLFEAPKTGRP